MDYFVLDAIVRDLAPELCHARIDKVFQPGRDRLLLRTWNGQQNKRLIIDVSPGEGRLHLISGNEPNPPRPPRFCQLLRARAKRILSLSLLPGERILHFVLQTEKGDSCHLYVEMLGMDGNFVLTTAEDRIIDVLHRTTKDAVRPLVPGAHYRPPASQKDLPLTEAAAMVGECDVHRFASHWQQRITPMSPLLAQGVLVRAEQTSLPTALCEAADQWQQGGHALCQGLINGRPILSVLPITHALLTDPVCTKDLQEGVMMFYGPGTPAATVSPKDRLVKTVARRLKKVQRRLKEIQKDEENAKDASTFKTYGELLLANLHQLKTGMECVTVPNWFSAENEAVTIALDPAKKPQENAHWYFRRSQKLQRGVEHRQRRLRETAEELDWLQQVRLSLDEATTTDEIGQIREEMEAAGVVRQKPGKQAKAPLKKDGLKRCRSPHGFDIRWGTNNRQNDLLLRSVAQAEDLWFHAHDLPGSHVVLSVQGAFVPDEDQRYAAAIAAGFSKGKDDPYVEVKRAYIRDLRRPKGGRPGYVLVDTFDTLRVAPMRPESTGRS